MSISDITDKINNDPLSAAIAHVLRAMSADYGRIFKAQFATKEDIADFRVMMRQRLSGVNIKAVYNGYLEASKASPEYCPNIIQITACIWAEDKRLKGVEKNRLEAERIALAPPLKITREVNPIAMLRAAIAQVALDEHGFTKEQKHEAHMKRLKDHEKLIAEFDAKKKLTAAGHTCSSSFCGNPGTMSHGTVGNGNYYCKDHFLRGA